MLTGLLSSTSLSDEWYSSFQLGMIAPRKRCEQRDDNKASRLSSPDDSEMNC
jgi:hypothetical protein